MLLMAAETPMADGTRGGHATRGDHAPHGGHRGHAAHGVFGLSPARRDALTRRVRLLVAATITYNVIEAVAALTAGTLASSTALIGFGLDSVIEVSSAAAVAWQFSAADHAVREAREKTTLRIIALSFFALASVRHHRRRPQALTGSRRARTLQCRRAAGPRRPLTIGGDFHRSPSTGRRGPGAVLGPVAADGRRTRTAPTLLVSSCRRRWWRGRVVLVALDRPGWSCRPSFSLAAPREFRAASPC
ncbi:hypothetical protein SANTM175S_02581 [Streptomyces antimycoticus]